MSVRLGYVRRANLNLVSEESGSPDRMTDVVILEAGRRAKHYWRDLWRYRELFRVLAWRDLTVRYKQTAIGVLWAVLRPFLSMAVFTIIFGHVAKLPSAGSAPYPLMVFAGMLPWTFFSSSLAEASGSLVMNSHLISKVYFPRLIVPTATVVVAFVDFSIGFGLMILLCLWYGFFPDWRIVFLPAFFLLAFLASMGPALWFTALNVKYRDFRHVIPFVIQFGLYVSPVGFSSAIVPQQWRLLYFLNPVAGVIDGFRWSLLAGQAPLYLPGLAVSTVVTFALFWVGLRQFRRMETSFADII